jgi:hypothetical protein
MRMLPNRLQKAQAVIHTLRTVSRVRQVPV